jgi:prepilin-type N-terminal cleavage/methylation domain-containing protein
MISPHARGHRAFTLMEVATAMVVICILAALTIPVLEVARSRIERINCSNNLHELYVAASGYYQEYRSWPQINPGLLGGPNNAYDEAWIEALLPFAATRAVWICPTIQREQGNPDYNQPQNYRADYIAMPYDNKPTTPLTWPTQPWFVERGNVHGTGNLVILANGSVTDLDTLNPIGAALTQ